MRQIRFSPPPVQSIYHRGGGGGGGGGEPLLFRHSIRELLRANKSRNGGKEDAPPMQLLTVKDSQNDLSGRKHITGIYHLTSTSCEIFCVLRFTRPASFTQNSLSAGAEQSNVWHLRPIQLRFTSSRCPGADQSDGPIHCSSRPRRRRVPY